MELANFFPSWVSKKIFIDCSEGNYCVSNNRCRVGCCLALVHLSVAVSGVVFVTCAGISTWGPQLRVTVGSVCFAP